MKQTYLVEVERHMVESASVLFETDADAPGDVERQVGALLGPVGAKTRAMRPVTNADARVMEEQMGYPRLGASEDLEEDHDILMGALSLGEKHVAEE